jgi:hypothetical protein
MKTFVRVLAVCFGLGALAAAGPSAAQSGARDLDHSKNLVRSVFERMPRERQRLLSGGAINAGQWARESLDHDRPEGESMLAAGAGFALHRDEGERSGRIRVNDPRTDFTRSVVSGMTQSETSTAWCGPNVVVGFNDSGSILETLAGTRGLSFAGVARSENGGRSFTDLGFLNPGPSVGGFILGDPVLACSSASRFHYASIFLLSTATPLTAVSLSTSNDGGQTFGDPAIAVSKDLNEHFLDKPWMAVDPGNPNNLYVTYTDFATFNTQPTCPFNFQTTIEIVGSKDGGQTWSAPVVLDEVCGFDTIVQGSQVVIGSAGDVNVAWEQFHTLETRAQAFRRSTDGGLTFGATATIADVTPAGSGFAYQGGFRSALEFPSLAVDRSSGPRRGSLYLVWNDGRNKQIADQDSIGGRYGYADVLFSRSTDHGVTWSTPVTANPDRADRTTDQYQPGVAVDRHGRVATCYYDRSLDPDNFKITRSCSLSRDGGAHWSFRRITDADDSFIPLHGGDTEVSPTYMGDYDALATDTLLGHSGFVGGFLVEEFQGNQNVLANLLD